MTSKDVKSIVRHMAVVLVELGRSAFLFALDSGIIAQVEGRIDNCNSMDETQEIAAVLAHINASSFARSCSKPWLPLLSGKD